MRSRRTVRARRTASQVRVARRGAGAGVTEHRNPSSRRAATGCRRRRVCGSWGTTSRRSAHNVAPVRESRPARRGCGKPLEPQTTTDQRAGSASTTRWPWRSAASRWSAESSVGCGGEPGGRCQGRRGRRSPRASLTRRTRPPRVLRSSASIAAFAWAATGMVTKPKPRGRPVSAGGGGGGRVRRARGPRRGRRAPRSWFRRAGCRRRFPWRLGVSGWVDAGGDTRSGRTLPAVVAHRSMRSVRRTGARRTFCGLVYGSFGQAMPQHVENRPGGTISGTVGSSGALEMASSRRSGTVGRRRAPRCARRP